MRAARALQPLSPRVCLPHRPLHSLHGLRGPSRRGFPHSLPLPEGSTPAGTATAGASGPPGLGAARLPQRAWPRPLWWPHGDFVLHPEATRHYPTSPSWSLDQPLPRQVTLHKPRPFPGPQFPHLCCEGWKNCHGLQPSRREGSGFFSPVPRSRGSAREMRVLCAPSSAHSPLLRCPGSEAPSAPS